MKSFYLYRVNLNMAPTLYVIHTSPPVRSVLITAKAIGLQLNEKQVDLYKKEQFTPEYLKLNPQHTVPTLEDDGFVVWDSHAINAYLVSKYAENDSLYPNDIRARAVVDQRLHFDSGVYFPTMQKALGKVIRLGEAINDSDIEQVNQLYQFLEAFLEGKKWMAGDSITIADYCLFSGVTTTNILIPVDAVKYPRVAIWLKNVESRPEAEANKNGLAHVENLFKTNLPQ